jgi:glutathione S-transferase
MRGLTVFTFSPAWGLPSSGPFALKLLKWLDLAGIAYTQLFEDNTARGPKGKNPWIEFDGERIGDTEIIIAALGRRHGFDLEADLSATERAHSHTLRRMLEEHLHMVLEWELFVHPEGAAEVGRMASASLPPLVAGTVASMLRRHFRQQLHARGIARHSDAVIAGKGKADIDALEALLGDRPFLLGEKLSMADVSAYGLLGPMAKWPMRTPVADDIKSRPALIAYLERMGIAKAEQRLAA